MAAKEILSQPIYYKTDTHWNSLGAYVGASALLKELGIELPDIGSNQITISEAGNKSGDLAGMLNLTKQLMFACQLYTVSGYETHSMELVENDFSNCIIYNATDADSRSIYIVRDSFSSAMGEYIGSQFNDTYMRHRGTYTYEDFLAQDPDIFVYETVERYAGGLATFSVQ